MKHLYLYLLLSQAEEVQQIVSSVTHHHNFHPIYYFLLSLLPFLYFPTAPGSLLSLLFTFFYSLFVTIYEECATLHFSLCIT